MALLGDDHFGLARMLRGVREVIFVAVEEQDQVRFLLDLS